MDTKGLVDAIVVEVTDVLTNGGSFSMTIDIEGLHAKVEVTATTSPATPQLSLDKSEEAKPA